MMKKMISTLAQTNNSLNLNTYHATGFMKVQEGSAQLQQTTETFKSINEAMQQVANHVVRMMQNVQGIAKEGKEFNASIQEITAITKEASAGVQGTEQLATLSTELDALVKQYKL
ncbi:hypothetical protein [Lysinibacillus varians]|uniref:Methyl-accepting transducer domain-containing protein n=1 Tax=Lysinibacillus varians TaxID=1145276 RepID=A0ABY2TET0_9BACI|nr:hypothetical protein [Lysinibacillus varians]TKI67125.1 hypothetical protein FC752_02595 [Lysinibacillus varians]